MTGPGDDDAGGPAPGGEGAAGGRASDQLNAEPTSGKPGFMYSALMSSAEA